MTEKRKLFKTLITRLMPVYTFRCFYRRAPKRTTGSVVLCHHWIYTHSSTYRAANSNTKIYFISPRNLQFLHTRVRDWEMNHKAPLLWIFLQCAAALFSFVLGENAVLKGKKRLCAHCSSISIIYFFPSLKGIKCQSLTPHMWSRSNMRSLKFVNEKYK